MELKELMKSPVISIEPEESVAVAARAFARHNIGAMPICGPDGRLLGLVTDRDLVTRCIASGKNPEKTPVEEIMSQDVLSAAPNTDAEAAARAMGARQIRRLPVLEHGILCGMISISDLSECSESAVSAEKAMGKILHGTSNRK